MSAVSGLQGDRVAALCDELRLSGVAESFAALAAHAVETEQSFVDYLEQALIAERDCRRARSAATLVRMAGFPAIKTLDAYDYNFATTAPRRQIEQLAGLGFVARRENVVFLGPSGVGKTQVSIATPGSMPRGSRSSIRLRRSDRGSDPVPGMTGTGS
jgi:DNA replication protein DnaC